MQLNRLVRFIGAAALGLLVASACGTKQDAVQYVDTAAPGDDVSGGDARADSTGASDGGSDTTPQFTVTYTADIAPKLTVCDACHQGTYNTYALAKQNVPGANQLIQDGIMPKPNGWPQATRALVQTWLDEGMPR